MPTISVNLKDLAELLGPAPRMHGPVTVERVETWLPLVKGEVKDHVDETDELRIELQDSNRPDLWSCEGIARQIRAKLEGKSRSYPFRGSTRASRRLVVAPGLEQIRPYVAACAAVGYRVTKHGLAQLIQTQEKLADIFGRKRRSVSIGLYRLPKIVFPVTYCLAKLDEARFVPLGFDEPMSLGDILAVHPKGVEYGTILAGLDRVPLLRDQEGQILSMPPIINSRDIGELQVGDSELFLEVTGMDLTMVLLTLNILAANLADRGAAIEPVAAVYPYVTSRGKTLCTPQEFGKPRTIPVKTIEAALGQSLGAEPIVRALKAYGYYAKASGKSVTVRLPPYRNDAMHAVDIAEDVAISRGYGEFVPIMPSQFTVGSLSRIEQVSDRVRDLMIGLGFQEIISNVLTSRQELCDRMRLSGTPWGLPVEIDNPISQSYSCLRHWITPSLLRVESASTRVFYPHRLFEVGEVAVLDPADAQGVRTVTMLGASIAHAGANFSEIHSCLDLLLFYLDFPYGLEPLAHPSFLEGRAGRIVSDGRPIGLIGELHPEVLEHWQIGMPCVALELEMDALAEKQ